MPIVRTIPVIGHSAIADSSLFNPKTTFPGLVFLIVFPAKLGEAKFAGNLISSFPTSGTNGSQVCSFDWNISSRVSSEHGELLEKSA